LKASITKEWTNIKYRTLELRLKIVGLTFEIKQNDAPPTIKRKRSFPLIHNKIKINGSKNSPRFREGELEIELNETFPDICQ
jgi:hypothetical protein